MYQFIIILDEIKGIRYSQNELNNGNLTAIQLVNYLRISHLQKNFHTLPKGRKTWLKCEVNQIKNSWYYLQSVFLWLWIIILLRR